MITFLASSGNVGTLAPEQYAYMSGTGFGTAPTLAELKTVVTLNGDPCTIVTISDTFISFQTPRNASLGTASVIVTGPGGASAAFNVTIVAHNPGPTGVSANGVNGLFAFTDGTVNLSPAPGDHLEFYGDGFGIVDGPFLPIVKIDGQDVPVVRVRFRPANTAFGEGRSYVRMANVIGIVIDFPAIPGGRHNLTLGIADDTSSNRPFTSIGTGMLVSQTGLRFNVVAGGPTLPPQTLNVISQSVPFNFTLSSTTISGGNWLSATPAQGSVIRDTAGVAVRVTASPAGLAPGSYYGFIKLVSTEVTNSPVTVTVVLTVVAANTALPMQLDRAGLAFVGAIGSAAVTQFAGVFNPTPNPVSYTTTLVNASTSLTIANPAGTIAPGQSVQIGARENFLGTAAFVRSNQLQIAFSDNTTRLVSLLELVTPAGSTGGASAGDPRFATGCTPTRLVPLFTQPGGSFNIPAAWPTQIEASIFTDCGDTFDRGTVTISFSNGDSPLRMTPLQNGRWSTTWPPANVRSSGINVNLFALQNAPPAFSGSATLVGGVNANALVPQVKRGGVVETAAYGSPVAPGNLVAIFGANMAAASQQATALPLPDQLLTTNVLLGGKQIPLFFASEGQVNAVVPYDLPPNTQQQIVIQRGNAISVPETVVIGAARPAVFTLDASGQGAGHIYKVDATGAQILADDKNPARAGDVLVIYCSGLGAVTPPLNAGAPVPMTFLTSAANPVTVTIGGRAATVLFSGLTPGLTGLYQINSTVPAGIAVGSAVPLVVSVSGESSPPVTFAIR